MPVFDDDQEDSDVPMQALKALSAAQQRSRVSGRTRVLVRDGNLIRIEGETVTILKKMPVGKKVHPRTPLPNR